MSDFLGGVTHWTPPALLSVLIVLIVTAVAKGWVVSAKVYETGLKQCEDHRTAEVAMQAQIAEMWRNIAETERASAAKAVETLAALTDTLREHNRREDLGGGR